MLPGGLTPLEGGHSGETFLADATGEPVVVRIYGARSAKAGPTKIDIDAAVLRLVRGLLPVPGILELRRPDFEADVPAVLVTERMPGTRLDLVLPEADPGLRRRIGEELGGLLNTLSGMPFLSPGRFEDAELRVGSWGPECADLRTFVEHLAPRSALAGWAENDLSALLEMADHAQDLLDPIGRTCLVHSDFNPKNLLVDPESGRITALLDWEFAHAGSPVADLGNLLRFDRDPELVDGVLSVFAAPDVEGDLVELGHAADLWALVELASRRTENPISERAHQRLVAITRSRRLDSVSR
ncbi:MAG: phosphotransferase [Nocardioides sp.]|nr:phosphotransferase [Nocardioides sp.]